MRLHIAAEDLNLSLHEDTLRASTTMPSAARELCRIKSEIKELKNLIDEAMAAVPECGADGHTKAVMVQLAQLDAMKRNMEMARDTLKEAMGLSSLFRTIDALLQGHDLQRLVDALQGLRRGLDIVGDSVPEFKGGKAKLFGLEQKVEEMIVNDIHKSLEDQKGDDTAYLYGLLDKLGKGDVFMEQYIMCRSKPLMALWDSFAAGTPFVSWLSTFYDELIRSFISECGWTKSYVPVRFPEAPISLFKNFFARIETPAKVRLAGAVSQAKNAPSQSIESVEQALGATSDFVDALRDALVDTEAAKSYEDGEIIDFISSAILPYEDVLAKYPDRELNHFSASITHHLSTGRFGYLWYYMTKNYLYSL